MKLTRKTCVHNKLIFEQNERDTLWSAAEIVAAVRDNNAFEGATDIYLHEKCDEIIKDIYELLNDYSNEYPLE